MSHDPIEPNQVSRERHDKQASRERHDKQVSRERHDKQVSRERHDKQVSRERHDNHVALNEALKNLPLQSPDEDRLHDVLAALQTRPAVFARPTLVKRRAVWLSGLAASLTMLAVAHFWPAMKSSDTNPAPVASVETTTTQRANTELSMLIADSQALENQLRALGRGRASLRQLDALSQAQLSLAALDNELSNLNESAQQNHTNSQRALWRERVAVLRAVKLGDYRPAQYSID
jgi:hypothetical protein